MIQNSPEFTLTDYIKFYQEENDSSISNKNSYEKDDDSMNNLLEDNQNLYLDFENINQIMNCPNISDNNNEEDQQVYFHKDIKEEDKDALFPSKKRNNNTNFEEYIESKNKLENIREDLNLCNKKTKESTGESPKIKKPIKFETTSKTCRNDYYIKKLKVECFSKYATKILNSLLKACKFPKSLNLTKIYMQNNKMFTSVANLKKNKEFLNIPIRVIFSMQNGNGQNQIKNMDIFSRIFNSRQKANNIDSYNELINNLNKTVEDVIREFYLSEKFEKFKMKEEIILYDKAFQKEKKFSLLKDNGFLKYIKG